MAPVRLGMVKPSVFASTNDVLDVVERFLYSEQDLSTLLANNNDSSLLNKRKRVCYLSVVYTKYLFFSIY